MAQTEMEQDVYKKFQDLVLDLNLDQTTADEAWSNYETLKLRYVMEGEQLAWVACAVYAACMQRVLPTVGGRPGSTVQGNCVSFTRMLHYCKITLLDFIKNQRLWLKMTHLDSQYFKSVDLLETKFAVSNNIYKKYGPIFLDLFTDPAKDAPRPVRSRKQRRPPCNATELFHFCWTLYILVKGKYPDITQDLVMSYSLLLSCVDLMYGNAKCIGRSDLFNKSCEGYPENSHSEEHGWDMKSMPDSVMDYLCRKFEGIVIETKVVQDYHWKPIIRTFIDKKILKGSPAGLFLLDCLHFESNVKEVRNAYESDLLSSGEFDERMFLTNDPVLGLSCISAVSPLQTAPVTPMPHIPKRGGLMLPGDCHLMPQTPITAGGRGASRHSPGNTAASSPLAAAAAALTRLYSIINGKTDKPSQRLAEILQSMSPDPVPRMTAVLAEMGQRFTKLYCSSEEEENTTPNNDSNAKSAHKYAKMRLGMANMLFYSFLETIIQDEISRGGDIQAIVKQEVLFRTLFVCCVELMLMCYNDLRKFPWSLQVGDVAAYYFVRIIEPVVRSDQQCDNRLSRELVKHLKRIEEQILDSLAWKSASPLWAILQEDSQGVPSCKDVNFSHLLDTSGSSSIGCATAGSGDSITSGQLQPPAAHQHSSVLMSPALQQHARHYTSPRQSPLSSAASERLGLRSPPSGSKGTVKRTLLFPPPAAADAKPSLAAPAAAAPPAIPAQQQDEGSGERPRRHGSLAIFFRKVYNVANLRLCDLCDRLEVVNGELRRKIWTCLEYSIIQHTHLLKDRHLDQLIMCAIYTMCKVTREDCIFQDIMKQYRCQPQADSHIYRSVLIKRITPDTGGESTTSSAPAEEASKSSKRSNLLPWKVNGTSTSFKTEERGDLIKFYNHVYVLNLRTFALKFKTTNSDSNAPPLSPLPLVRVTPASPRRRISSSRPVYVHSLSPASSAAAASPRRPLPYVFNRSPSKDLRVINSMVHLRGGVPGKRLHPDTSAQQQHPAKRTMIGLSRRLNTVLDERQRSTDTTADSGRSSSSSLSLSSSLSSLAGGGEGVVLITNGAAGVLSPPDTPRVVVASTPNQEASAPQHNGHS